MVRLSILQPSKRCSLLRERKSHRLLSATGGPVLGPARYSTYHAAGILQVTGGNRGQWTAFASQLCFGVMLGKGKEKKKEAHPVAAIFMSTTVSYRIDAGRALPDSDRHTDRDI